MERGEEQRVPDPVEGLLDVEEYNRTRHPMVSGLALTVRVVEILAADSTDGGEKKIDGVCSGVVGAEAELERREEAPTLQLGGQAAVDEVFQGADDDGGH